MKRILSLLAIPVLLMVTAAPVMAQEALPYTTDLITEDRRTTQEDVGDLTVNTDGAIIFQIDEATDWRLSETLLYVSDTPPARGLQGRSLSRHNRLNGAVSDVFNVDLNAADRNGDGIVYIAAQAELVRQTDRNPRARRPTFFNRTTTARAQGDESTGRGSNQGTFFAVSVTQPSDDQAGPIG